MMAYYDAIIRDGTVVKQDGLGGVDIGMRDVRIVEVGNLASETADIDMDCEGLHVLPGVIDTQAHFREPGLTHKDDLETGSRSAVTGGVTAVFEMPNTSDGDARDLRNQDRGGDESHAL